LIVCMWLLAKRNCSGQASICRTHWIFVNYLNSNNNKELQKNKGLGKFKTVKIIILCSIALIFAPIKTVHGGEDVPNIKVVERLLEASLDSLDLSKSVESFSFGPVQVQQRGYLQNYLAHYFSHGYLDSSALGIKEFHVEQFAIGIVYVSDFAVLPWQVDSLLRVVRLSYSGWYVLKKSGSVIPFSDSRQIKGFIADGQREKLETSPYAFCRGTLRNTSIWSKVAEPVLLVTTVATLVYLFFTVRS